MTNLAKALIRPLDRPSLGKLQLFAIGKPHTSRLEISAWEQIARMDTSGVAHPSGDFIVLVSRIDPCMSLYGDGELASTVTKYFNSVLAVTAFVTSAKREVRLVSMSLEEVFSSMFKLFAKNGHGFEIKCSPNAKRILANQL